MEDKTKTLKRKNLGQYFTGVPLAKLITSLIELNSPRIIDPMCGIGDMLEASKNKFSAYQNLVGVELDSKAYKELNKRFSNSTSSKFESYRGNIFDPKVLNNLSSYGYDLVITNPPYVRYQNYSTASEENSIQLPPKEIKKGLRSAVDYFECGDAQDKAFYNQIIESYSGLSDLAVPSWILCSILTKIDGYLAILVPNTWLSRDYSLIIQYLLLRNFELQYIIEDSNAVWFDGVQVKTSIVIAKKIPLKDSICDWANEKYSFVEIYKEAKNDNSIVGNLYLNEENPEKSFAEEIVNSEISNNKYIKVTRQPILRLAKQVIDKSNKSSWLSKWEDSQMILENNNTLPFKIYQWAKNGLLEYKKLDDLNVEIGQGLRTGANKFFYLELLEEGKEYSLVRTHKIFGENKIKVANGLIRKTLRYQRELNDQLYIESNDVNYVLLYLQENILPKDITLLKEKGLLNLLFNPIDSELAEYIRKAEKLNIGTESHPKFVPELSAVETNQRKWNPDKPGVLPRFWYMLPKLQKRHIPELFIPRVNNLYPQTYLNPDQIVIDANFSSIWFNGYRSRLDQYSLFAILNSSWFQVCLEEFATVMGGGALKVEATNLRDIPIPHFGNEDIVKLSKFGRKLLENQSFKETQKDIDRQFIKSLFGAYNEDKLSELYQMKEEYLKKRN